MSNEYQELEGLKNSLLDLKEEEALNLAFGLLAGGTDGDEIKEALKPALTEIGRRLEAGRYFASSLVPVGQAVRKILEKIHGRPDQDPFPGRALLVTASGLSPQNNLDSLLALILGSLGFEVWDLGEEASQETFLAEAQIFRPRVVGFRQGRLTRGERLQRLIRLIRENWPYGPQPYVFLVGPKTASAQRKTGADRTISSISGTLDMYHALAMSYPYGSFAP
jgi:methanogenic corrinoid protein MtbC1